MAEATQTPGEGRGPGGGMQVLRFRDNADAGHAADNGSSSNDAVSDEPAVTVDAFAGQTNAGAVRIEPGDDARELIPHLGHLTRIEVSFPSFGDGRGYSAARILREAGYRGEIRAVGDVLVDQIFHLRRCGFDAFEPDTPLDEAKVEEALSRWDEVYQPTTDGRVPIWALRHGSPNAGGQNTGSQNRGAQGGVGGDDG